MLYDTKREIEQHFIDNWSTPIQFEGVDFAAPSKWVRLAFIPIDRTANTSKRVFENSQLKVFCYDVSPTLCVKLVDEVNTFLDCLDLSTCRFGTGQSDGLGTQPLDNGVYELVTLFEVDKTI